NTMKDRFQLRRIDVYKSDRIACRLSYTKTPSVICMKDGAVVENITDLSAIEQKITDLVQKHG
ncbi:MAG TPA: pyridine nucleotide-disulfide oxidoreductase, partial [Treponemataceae bacterium]|nr:pyridine nucleotide-disulfide oxidoreductase [Treponemataceae bacterium]